MNNQITSRHTCTHTDVMNTHLSPGRSLERKLRCTGCGGPGEVRHAQNRTLSLGHESYMDSLTPGCRDRGRRGRRKWERRRGRSRGCRARRRGRDRACQGGWRQRWKDGRRMRKVRRAWLGVRRGSECWPPPPSCYCDCPLRQLTRTSLKHTRTHTDMHIKHADVPTEHVDG